MNQTKIIIRMDSGNCLEAVFPNFEDAVDELKNIQKSIETECAKGSDFIFANTSVFCISKIESIFIERKQGNND